MKPTVLLFHLDPEKHAPLMATAARLQIQVKHVPPAQSGQTLSALLGLSPLDEDAAGGEMQQEMMVMADFTRRMMDDFLGGLRTLGMKPIRLKAVVTPTNMGWTADALCRELLEEAAAMTRSRAAQESEGTPR